ncbi:hypothetical protein [Polyangium jinanense]|uniref:STAS domain-containing protein n=1 Tax=Polyangium jinanense TaxID=2829994 RepID=A0A9X4AW12_9BACT|nr:hypothetical protein [Polyangium jinanense]MDC3960596.1 hypothetical protein [Polyangium jinanense]MDC3986884.1 hypothetical protein [Polyangium jinanense]
MEPPTLRTPTSHPDVWVEQPDILHVTMRGTIDVAEATPLLAAQLAAAETWSHGIVFCDVSRLEWMSMEARRAFAETRNIGPRRAIVVIGANATLRTIADLLFRAVRALRPKHASPTRFVRDLDEARAAVPELRRLLGAHSDP